jgi:hypothetical protein
MSLFPAGPDVCGLTETYLPEMGPKTDDSVRFVRHERELWQLNGFSTGRTGPEGGLMKPVSYHALPFRQP